MSARSRNSVTPADPAEFESRFPRRLLFAGAAAGITGATVVASAAPAEAASGTTAWLLGGNSDVASSNFLGPTQSGATLVFKTKANAAAAVTEKMRLTAGGFLGVGTTSPSAKIDVTAGGSAVRGRSTNTTATGRGVIGSAPNGYGVQGTSPSNVGVHGEGYTGVSATGTAYGIYADGGTYGGYFTGGAFGSYSYGPAYGVLGYATSSGTGIYGSGGTGVYGISSTAAGNGVRGSGGQFAVQGVSGSSAGVRGDSGYVGVWAQAPTYAVYANSTATTGQVYGVYASTASPAGYAFFAQGNSHINGTLSKSAGSFRIDHPLDPEKKWLSHSFVESPDMMNIYNGNVTTDGSGNATVGLPAYFGALNRDFRYQLTVIGDFAQAVVSKEVADNSFAIKTDKPKVKVSWQVTGVRQDSYATEHPIVVESAKTGTDVGARQFVPKGSSAKSAQYGPAAVSASITPSSPKDSDLAKPQDKAAGTAASTAQ